MKITETPPKDDKNPLTIEFTVDELNILAAMLDCGGNPLTSTRVKTDIMKGELEKAGYHWSNSSYSFHKSESVYWGDKF